MKRRFRFLIRRADAARDERRFESAAALYEEALRLQPRHPGALMQRAHMLKEIGNLDLAEQLYAEVERWRPNDAEVSLQRGHFFKVAARPGEAIAAYRRALELRPGWEEAVKELSWMENASSRVRVLPQEPVNFAIEFDGQTGAFEGFSAAEVASLVPRLAPRPIEALLHLHGEELSVRRFGRRESGFWGNRTTLRGVEGLRGFCVSETPIVDVQVLLNGIRIHRGPVAGGYDLVLEREKARIKKYVFNVWLDFSAEVRGLHAVEVRCTDARGRARSFHEDVVISDPVSEEEFPDSNVLVSVSSDDPRTIEEQIRSRPSMVRSAKRSLLPDGVHNVLVMRTDQLGDMVASIPAMQRLREIVPGARIIGLLTAANAELARTLDVFDDVITIDFPDDRLEGRRLMTLRAQAALRDQLAPYAFDIAIDLAQAPVSRDLLPLSGAKFLFGTGGEDWPWLTSDFMFHTRDRWNRHDFTPHSSKVLALVETLGTLLKTSAPVIRRVDLAREMLNDYGIGISEPYALFHTGARIGFSRWPFYGDLARMFLSLTEFKVVIMTEDPEFRTTLPADVLNDPRVILLDRRLPFDDFDAFISFATVMVGNDSGPKHLASLRGTDVVTIFSARINWTEWGQENVGSIISRKLPCAGCALLHAPEECGRDFICITDIKPNEVFKAMMDLVGGREAAEA